VLSTVCVKEPDNISKKIRF